MAVALLFDTSGGDTFISVQSEAVASRIQQSIYELAGWTYNKFNCGNPDDLRLVQYILYNFVLKHVPFRGS